MRKKTGLRLDMVGVASVYTLCDLVTIFQRQLSSAPKEQGVWSLDCEET